MANVYMSRMYSPAEDANKPDERDVLYPETNIESIVTRTNGKKLSEDFGLKVCAGTSLINQTTKEDYPSDETFFSEVLNLQKGTTPLGDFTP